MKKVRPANNDWFQLPNIYDPKLSMKETGATISKLGVKKANTKFWQLLILGILAGLYISVGGHLFLVAKSAGHGQIVSGFVFSVGLVLVVIAGAELFTGNIIMIVGALATLYSPFKLLRNWTAVYLGNLVGALFYAFCVYYCGVLDGALGETATAVAVKKMGVSFGALFIRGFFCNLLVILAIIMSVIAKDITSKIISCSLPIMAFVALGFDHCVANMFLIPAGLLTGGQEAWKFWDMFPKNIFPVTLGNIFGGLFIILIHPNRINQIIELITHKKKKKRKK